MRKTLPSNAALIPDNASLAFKGQIFDVYQWPQIMFDGSTKTFEMLKRPDTVQIILVRDNKILLVEDEQPAGLHGYISRAGVPMKTIRGRQPLSANCVRKRALYALTSNWSVSNSQRLRLSGLRQSFWPLISPKKASSNLILTEKKSPSSGTPLRMSAGMFCLAGNR
jgi:hypothetical protein